MINIELSHDGIKLTENNKHDGVDTRYDMIEFYSF